MHLLQVLTLSNILQTLIRLVIVLSGSPTIDCLKLTYSNHSNFLFNPLSDLEITEKGYNKLFERLVRFLQYIAIEKSETFAKSFSFFRFWNSNQSVINIFEYIEHKYLFAKFVFMNILWHSFVSVLGCAKKSNIQIHIFKYSYNFQHKYLFGHSFVSNFLYKYIWTFVRVSFYANIFRNLFVSKFLQMSHSDSNVTLWFKLP